MPETGSVFELNKSENSLDIRFSSTMAQIDEVCILVTRFLESRGEALSPHFFAVNLVIREGLTNAVRHGNKTDPGKTVRFRMEIDDRKTIRVSIEDQGKGFDWQAARSAPLFETADHGRGMLIMEAYFDRCCYNETGNVLYLEKKIPPPARGLIRD